MKGKKNTIVLSFGGNLKDSKSCFKKAEQLIEKEIGKIKSTSSLYKSEAWGFNNKTNDFLNQVIIVKTNLAPQLILSITQKIEKNLGRKTKSKDHSYKDRIIDIDLLFFNNKLIEEENLQIPHYLIEKRKFILLPLSELIPNYIHPVLKKTIKELLLHCSDKLKIEKLIN